MPKGTNGYSKKLVEVNSNTGVVSDILFILSHLDFYGVIDILLVALLFYWVLTLIQGTQAVQLLRGVLILAVLAAIAASLLKTLIAFSWLVDKALPALLVAIPIIFQPELRRALERLGRTPRLAATHHSSQLEQAIEAVSQAVIDLSRQEHGALIVFERQTGLENYSEAGVRLEANVTSELLTTIFFNGTSLHDGAVIIRGSKIVAAAVVLPLEETTLAGKRSLGTRHRAAISITEMTDALAVVVSEETGIISVVNNGQLTRGLDKKRLEQLLTTFYQSQFQTENLSRWHSFGQTILQRLGLVKPTIPKAQSHSKQ
jgi:diadenylate cyclase